MKKTLLTAAFITASLLGEQVQAQSLVGITDANSIFTMANVSAPSSINGPYSVSGVASGQMLIGIDRRPSTGELPRSGHGHVCCPATETIQTSIIIQCL